jgi:hypothetical protein
MPVFSIDTTAAKYFAGKLQTMKRSAFPNAVRETLSKSALNVKQKTMPASAKKAFTERQKNFFKANSKVDFAKGYDIKRMEATIGFVSEKLKGGNNYAVKDLEQQEEGGQIKKRTFIPIDTARTGKSKSKLVQKKNILEKIKNIVKVRRTGNAKQAWVKAAIIAKKLYGNDAYVLGRAKEGKQTLSRINNITRPGGARDISINRTPLYSVVKGRAVAVKGTQFMKRASYETQSNMNAVFIIEAQKQINRLAK